MSLQAKILIDSANPDSCLRWWWMFNHYLRKSAVNLRPTVFCVRTSATFHAQGKQRIQHMNANWWINSLKDPSGSHSSDNITKCWIQGTFHHQGVNGRREGQCGMFERVKLVWRLVHSCQESMLASTMCVEGENHSDCFWKFWQDVVGFRTFVSVMSLPVLFRSVPLFSEWRFLVVAVGMWHKLAWWTILVQLIDKFRWNDVNGAVRDTTREYSG